MKFLKEIILYAIIFLSVILIRSYIITPVIVSGDSMNDTLKDGELLLLKKFDNDYSRFDVVVFKYEDSKLIKRIIGLPGEHIAYKSGVLYINGERVEESLSSITSNFELEEIGYDVIPDGYYFVLGDNRRNSSDSRIIGLINKKDIEGITDFRIWPFGSF